MRSIVGILQVTDVRTKLMELHGGSRASRGKSAGDIRSQRNFYDKCITRKCLTFKMKVKDTEYTNRNDPIWWQILTSIKVIFKHISLALTVFQKFTFQISWTWKCSSKSWCTTLAVFDDKHLTSYLMAIVMFAFFQQMLWRIANWKVWPWKYYNIRSYAIRWRMLTYIKVILAFLR